MTIYSLVVFLSQFWTTSLFHVHFCYFLTCTQVLQEAGKVVWYSHLFTNFPQFVVIYTAKGFNIVNKEEVDVFFLEFPCFFYDPTDIGNLISGSSAFSKSSFYIWNFSVHILLKPSLKDFEQYFASMWIYDKSSDTSYVINEPGKNTGMFSIPTQEYRNHSLLQGWRHYAKWNQKDTKGQILHESYLYAVPRIVKCTATESRIVVTRAGRR